MKHIILAAFALSMTGCFRHYVYVRPERPLIPVESVEKPTLHALSGEAINLSPEAQADLNALVEYVVALRAVIDAYNKEVEAFNAESPTP